eukprot:403365667
MQCPQCIQLYHQETNIPRILIGCGHTLCEKCILSCFANKSQTNYMKQVIECPECGTLNEADSVQSFPKNLALLNMAPMATVVQTQNKQQANANQNNIQNKMSKKPITLSGKDITKNFRSPRKEEPMCNIHNKKLEAYCQIEKQTLCIDCILSEQHKNHEIHSIQKAAELERDFILQKFNQSQDLLQQIQDQNTDIKGHLEMLKEQSTKNTVDIKLVFQEIRKVIDEKENQIISTIQKSLEKEEMYLMDRFKSNNGQIDVISNFEREYVTVSTEEDIKMLSKTGQRREIAEQSLQSNSKVAFNHIFNDIKKEKEFLAISKVFKDLSNGKDPLSTPTSAIPQSNPNRQSFQGPPQQTTNSSVASNYMQVTHSWANKNKPTGGAIGSSTTQANTGQTTNQTATTNSRATNKVGTSAMRSQSKDRRLVQNKTKKSDKGVADMTGGSGSSGISSSFNFPGSFNSNELIQNFQNQSSTPVQNKGKAQDLLRAQNSSSNIGLTKMNSSSSGNGNFEDLSKAFKSSKDYQITQNSANNTSTTGGSSSNGVQILSQQTVKEKKQNPIPIPTQSQSSTNLNSNISPRPKTASCYIPRSTNPPSSQYNTNNNSNNYETTPNTGSNKDSKPVINRNAQNQQSSENLLMKANTMISKNQPQSLAELRNKVKSQKNNQLQQALQTQEENINMLQKYKTQIDNEKTQQQNSITIIPNGSLSSNVSPMMEEDFNNTMPAICQEFNDQTQKSPPAQGLQKSQTQNIKMAAADLNQDKKSRELERKQELLQKAFGLSGGSIDGKENSYGIKNTKQGQKKKYLNQPAGAGTGGSTKNGTTTTVCHVDLLNDPVPTTIQLQQHNKVSTHKESFEKTNTFEMANENMIVNGEESQYIGQNDHDMRGNMSITKSLADYYQNYQHTIGNDELMSLCRSNQQFIYAISGFCENSLGNVERLNIDTMQWEELCEVNVPRTKFSVIQSPLNMNEILMLGGKDHEGNRLQAIESYNCVENKWNLYPDVKLRKPRSGFAAISLRNEYKIYIIGGNDGRVQNRVECLNLNTKLWSKIPKMNMKRDELAACLGPDNKIYAIGGYGGGDNACLSSAERYDPQTGKWELIASMKEARRALAAVALPDGIYAIGGYNGKEYINTVEKYDFFTNEWAIIKPMNTPRCTLAAVASTDCQYIYVVGGFNGTPLNTIERYNVTNEEWESDIPQMNQKRFMHSCIMVNL